MPLDSLRRALVAALLVPSLAGPPALARAPTALPVYLPRYRVAIDLDVARGLAHVRQQATWTNPTPTPTDRLFFNVHSRYVVPPDQVGFTAKMLEILRVQPSEALGISEPPCDIRRIALADGPDRGASLPFRYEGDTLTTLVVPLPRIVGPGESVTVVLDLTMRLPPKQGRWGQWEGVTFLSNWLPVFAYYGEGGFGSEGRPRSLATARGSAPRIVRAAPDTVRWQPAPFVPWHQPFFNEAGLYDVSICLPANQNFATSGTVRAITQLGGGRQRIDIEAHGVREFTFLCSARYQVYEGRALAGPGGAPVRIRVLAFPEHEFHARHAVRIAAYALETYSKWFGPYPWPDFSVAEAFFGWNGNECSTLVMIDERVFAMPHLAVGYVEYLLSHEICHQWWYNLVGTNGYCETWMDEGPANYFSHRLLDQKHGKDQLLLRYPAGLEWLPNIRRNDYRSSGLYSTLGKGEMTPVVQEMPKFGHLGNLFSMCYDKGGRLVGMMEERLREPEFFAFIQLIVRKYSHRILRVRDLQRELEQYTGRSWDEFFARWLHGSGMSDWSVEKVALTRAPKCFADRPRCCLLRRKLLLARGVSDEEDAIPPGGVRLAVWLDQKADYDEPTTLGIALPGREGFPIRIPILPGAQEYRLDDLRARIVPLEPGKNGGARFKVEVVLPDEPTQVAVDPDQILVDAEPANNYWHSPIRWRITPLYSFLEETDLTNAYDRYNVIAGPWLFSPTFNDAWFTRSTMAGARVGIYRTQQFAGGIYTGYRSNFRDVICGIDGTWDHWPHPKSQVGFIAERRLAELNNGDGEATRGVLFARRIFTYGSSLYLPPIHFIEAFVQYSDNFLPFSTQTVPTGVRFDRTATTGLHYKLNYLTPYWDPEGGFALDAWYEGGLAEEPSFDGKALFPRRGTVGLQKVAGQFSFVKSAPSLGRHFEGAPVVQRAFDWLGQTRLAFRAYGATAAPSRGEFFSMGGSELFRGFDLAQRQGSTVWVGSFEWRVPLARRVAVDALDHVASLRNVHAALFYDAGDAWTAGRSVGPVAHAVGMGLRLDVSWLSFVERTTLRLDVAKGLNTDTGMQIWLGLNHPF